jgi:ABC-type antimicrobial peptide transport system permease subunit
MASAIVVLVTLIASYAPAYRASRLNPLTALRHE